MATRKETYIGFETDPELKAAVLAVKKDAERSVAKIMPAFILLGLQAYEAEGVELFQRMKDVLPVFPKKRAGSQTGNGDDVESRASPPTPPKSSGDAQSDRGRRPPARSRS